MGTVSRNFDYAEFEKTNYSEYQSRNKITDAAVRDSIAELVNTVLQPLRDAWGGPLTINSGYRCPELNAKVGGVSTSQHCKGEAADVHADDPYALASVAQTMELPFDQMILYPTFVHFSHRKGGPQRGQILYNKSYKGKRL